jgi:hypothetical protein
VGPQVWVQCSAPADWVPDAAIFLGFKEAGLESDAALDSGFLVLAVSLVAVTMGFLGANMTV